MAETIGGTAGDADAVSKAAYCWKVAGQWQRLALSVSGAPVEAAPGSDAEFITEHHWGYTAFPDGSAREYRVEHPKWRIWDNAAHGFEGKMEQTYGATWVETLGRPPSSAFLGDGSQVTVGFGRKIPSA